MFFVAKICKRALRASIEGYLAVSASTPTSATLMGMIIVVVPSTTVVVVVMVVTLMTMMMVVPWKMKMKSGRRDPQEVRAIKFLSCFEKLIARNHISDLTLNF